ncbi:DUF1176 domain-containing protein [Sphingomonas sp.]|uniref:DUF1176 domain-containing protein n=1 Tax=Sphingomonas sp. TaxID=28214 RepID=UPI001B0E69C9|nr:DUF1176 domain-containing protein [Sphingomonas sp.]MBO9713037.1 DUF1176 domain-containing protein [Sphingomonas sp.]
MLILPPMLLAAPADDPVKVFGDWVVACDNVKRCEMTSLLPGDEAMPEADDPAGDSSLSVVREAGPAGGWSVEFSTRPYAGKASATIDGVAIASGTAREGLVDFSGADAAKLVAAMTNGKEAGLKDASGKPIARISLSGSSASLRFIDAAQGRAGSVTAAVAKGARPATAVPAAAVLPVVKRAMPSGKVESVSKTLRAAMDKLGDCAGVYEGGEGDPPEVETHALGGGKTLALLPCGSGAYNFSTVPFIVSGGHATVARFDVLGGESEAEGIAMLTNAGWDTKTATLSSYDKGRGIGDCGTAEDYVWTGEMFVLVEARSMPECRGSVNWLTTFRAKPVP